MAAKDVLAVVLAAGSSRRFGEGSKLLAEWKGKPLITYVVLALKQLECVKQVAIISRPGDALLYNALRDFNLLFTENEAHAEGIGSSVRIAAENAGNSAGLLLCPGDLPNILPATLEKLVMAWEPEQGIAACSQAGELCSPALFGRSWYGELLKCRGDSGAKWILNQNRSQVKSIQVEPGELFDIDLRSDLNLGQ